MTYLISNSRKDYSLIEVLLRYFPRELTGNNEYLRGDISTDISLIYKDILF